MELYHIGAKIEKITTEGLFGSHLFFSDEENHYGDTVYKIEIDESEIIEASRMFFIDDSHNICAKMIKKVAELLSISDD